MTKLEVRKSKLCSSQSLRDAARAEFERRRPVRPKSKPNCGPSGVRLPPLVKAAEFVCDVNGDPPSIDTLRTALEKHKYRVALGDELRDVVERKNEASIESRRYQWAAGSINSMFFLVVGEGDTRKEALDKAKVKES